MEKYLFIVLLSSLCLNAYSQEHTITGNVTAFKEFPLNEVSIKAKKSKTKVLSDSLGNFTIASQANDIIFFVASGFETQRIKVKNTDLIEVNLIYKGNQQDYNDAIRRDHLSKETLDYCIDNLFENNNNFDRMASMEQIIKSVYPAAKIVRDGPIEKVVLGSRGPNSINAGTGVATNNQALLLVDGIPVEEISSIQPDTVKSIKVHVGTAASRWGSRGGNGVVEIFLKQP